MSFAEINGTTLYYTVEGEGLPILFIHPPLLASDNFKDQLQQLSDRYQVIAFDIRGHGNSRYSEQPITYPLIVEDMRQLLDHLGVQKALLCGYSTGGSIALEAMLAYPERFIGGILVSAMSEVSDFRLKSEIWTAVGLSGIRAKRLLAATIAWGNSSKLDTFKRLFHSAMKGHAANWRQYYRYSLTYNCTDKLHQIKAPNLLLYGKKDGRFDRYANILHKLLPDNTLYFVKQVSHQLPTKTPDTMNGLIRQWIEERFPKTMNQSRDEQETPFFPEPQISAENDFPESTV